MTQSLRAFLFDCDGTLFDTECLKAKSWGAGMARYLRRMGTFPEADLKRIEDEVPGMYQAGGTREKVVHDILKRCEGRFSPEIDGVIRSVDVKTLVELRTTARDEILEEAFPRTGPPDNGNSSHAIWPVWAFAVAVKRQGHTVALVTNAERSWVDRYFHASALEDHTGRVVDRPEDFFEVAVCGKEKGMGVKEAVCKVLGRMAPGDAADDDAIDAVFSGIPDEEIRSFVIVEDSADGVKAARSVGVRAIAIPNEFTRNDFPHLLLSYASLEGMSPARLVEALEQSEGGAPRSAAAGSAAPHHRQQDAASRTREARETGGEGSRGQGIRTARNRTGAKTRKREELGT